MVNIISVSVSVGIGLCVLLLVAILIETIVSLIWSWVDDGNYKLKHKIIDFIAVKVMGYEEMESEVWRYYNADCSRAVDRGGIVFRVIFTLLLVPIIAGVLIIFWNLTLYALTFIGLAWTLRFVRRLTKKFEFHVKDQSAHKEEEVG